MIFLQNATLTQVHNKTFVYGFNKDFPLHLARKINNNEIE